MVLPRGIGQKIWIAAGSLGGIVLLAAVGTLVVNKWRDGRANALFTEATQLVQQGQETEKRSSAIKLHYVEGSQEPQKITYIKDYPSYIAALQHYEQALANVRRLAEDYPATIAARKVADGDVRLGLYAISEIKTTLLPKMRDKALLLAVENKDTATARGLLAKGANPNVRESDPHWGQTGDSNIAGDTPLHLAAAKGHAEIAQELIKAGADVNSVYKAGVGHETYDINSFTPLTNAAAGGYAHVVRLLLDAGADAKSTACNNYCLTSIGHALNGGHADIVDMLLKAGASLAFDRSEYAPYPGDAKDPSRNNLNNIM